MDATSSFEKIAVSQIKLSEGDLDSVIEPGESHLMMLCIFRKFGNASPSAIEVVVGG
jgi:hypothetical protein